MQTTGVNALTIAGLDPSGGAGILADIKSFDNMAVQGFAVVTGNTVQTEDEFKGLEWVKLDFILEQLDLLLSRYTIDFCKVGLVRNIDELNQILDFLITKNPEIRVIWDPIKCASAGFVFHQEAQQSELIEVLQKVYLVTPNTDEKEFLLKESGFDLSELAQTTHVLLKGGHHEQDANDILMFENQETVFPSERIAGAQKHGTGCTLSAVITAALTKGKSLEDAVKIGKEYVQKLLVSTDTLLGMHHGIV